MSATPLPKVGIGWNPEIETAIAIMLEGKAGSETPSVARPSTRAVTRPRTGPFRVVRSDRPPLADPKRDPERSHG